MSHNCPAYSNLYKWAVLSASTPAHHRFFLAVPNLKNLSTLLFLLFWLQSSSYYLFNIDQRTANTSMLAQKRWLLTRTSNMGERVQNNEARNWLGIRNWGIEHQTLFTEKGKNTLKATAMDYNAGILHYLNNNSNNNNINNDIQMCYIYIYSC